MAGMLIVALDFPNEKLALDFIDPLSPEDCICFRRARHA